MKYPAPGTVRWHVSEFVRKHVNADSAPVLEVGSKRNDDQWWRDLRSHCGVSREDWTGMDLAPGPNIDFCDDIVEHLPADQYTNAFKTVVCAEVLEHVSDPWGAVCYLINALQPGGTVVITTPFAFPIHNFPDDYWRFTPSGIRYLLEFTGFTDIHTEEMNHMEIELNDHGDNVTPCRVPLHVGAVARKPE